MIIPSIDIQAGTTVQLIGGERLAIDAGDPLDRVEAFGRVGEVAVIDLDAAKGEGDNRSTIETLCDRARCRVGGGIRDYQSARRWLDRGAAKIIVGTAASPDLLRKLPRERVIVALDTRDGDVVTHGWRVGSGTTIEDRLHELAPHAGGFLFTSVEREGRLRGCDLDRAKELIRGCGEARATIAGGITTAEEIAELDRLGGDAQVGMALYTDRLTLAEAFAAPLRSDRPDGLWPTLVADEGERLLGLAWSSRQSLQEALTSGTGVYQSRRRGIWRKGETSGSTQSLLRVDLDCDRDAIRFTVKQAGSGFCHRNTRTCFGESRGIAALAERLLERQARPPIGSYTARLLADPALLASKLAEEALELGEARDKSDVVHEAADLLYFTSVAMARSGVSLADVEECLDRRALKIIRRPGDAKESEL